MANETEPAPVIDDPEQNPRLALPAGQLRIRGGAALEAPAQGSLGLLALGWVGLRLWRQGREAGGWRPSTPPPRVQPDD